MTIWIGTDGRPSNSAKLLSRVAGFRRLRLGNLVKPGDAVVNWGSSKTDRPDVINSAYAVRVAANKHLTFSVLSGAQVPVVPWTANVAVAREWQAKGSTVVVRKTLTGHSGDGILIVGPDGGELPPDAPLYTKYIFKVKEYRVHATRLGAFDVQQKVRDPERVPLTWKVRSHANGFIFQRKNIGRAADLHELGVMAVRAIGLDFGAVDIIEDKNGELFVLEVNTSPGLEGASTELYADALRGLADA